MASTERFKYFAFILYPESCPNPFPILEDLHVPLIVSPVHDMDIKEGTFDEFKKPHRHVLLEFESLKCVAQVLKLLAPLGVSYVEPVQCRVAYERYLCHLDNPTKAQYDPDEVICMNGASYLKDDDASIHATLRQIINYLVDCKPRPSPENFYLIAMDHDSWLSVLRIPAFQKIIYSFLRS